MTTEYTCPGCDSTVLVPDAAASLLGMHEHIGCGNTDEHDSGDSLVMWEEEDDT